MKKTINFPCRSGESVGVEVGAFGFVIAQTSFTLSGIFLNAECRGGVESRHELNERPTALRDACSPALVNSSSQSSAWPSTLSIQSAGKLTRVASR